MAQKPPNARETSTGLIITLVFFILLSIGLGVATYYGFAEQEKLKGDAKTAAGKEKKANDERDFYRFEAHLMRAYMGVPFEGVAAEAPKEGEAADPKTTARDRLASDKGNLAGGKFGTGLSEERKREVEELKTLIAGKIEVPGKCGAWNIDQAKPEKSYEDLLADERKNVAQLRQQLDDANVELAKARAAQKSAEDNLKATKDEYNKKYEDLNAERQKDLANYNNDVAKFTQQIKDMTAKRPDNGAKYYAERDEALKARDLMAKELKETKEKVAILQSRVDAKEDQKPMNARILGQIVSIQQNGKKAYINLGTESGVKAQQTFGVYTLDPNGKPRPDPKASIEVVNVVREKLSEVIITTMYSKERDPYTDRLRQIPVDDAKNIDPVVKGDVLINPTWNPNAKIHVAITGVVDLKADGIDNMDAFIRTMEKQNVIVDAYIDTRDMTIKGNGITPKTELLIIGDQPYSSDPTGKTQKAEKLAKSMEEMRAQANKYGLTPKKLTKFLEETGYRMEKRVED